MSKGVFALGLLLLAACGSADGGAQGAPADVTQLGDRGAIRFEITSDAPVATGVNVLHVALRDPASGAPVDVDALDVRAIMPAMGHGASVTPQVTREAVGLYRVEDVVCSMPGRWNVTCAATSAGETRDALTVPFDVQ